MGEKTYLVFGYRKLKGGKSEALVQVGKVRANNVRRARAKMNKKFPNKTTSLVEKKNVRYKDR